MTRGPGRRGRPVGSPLTVPAPPWVEVVALGAGARPEALGADLPGFVVRQLDGRRCGTKASLLRELAEGFAFPAHFGENWDALEDCLADLEWLPGSGYLLIVADADRLLAAHPADYRTLVEILNAVGAQWARPRSGPTSRPARPFHTLLAVPEAALTRRPDWLATVRRSDSGRRDPEHRGHRGS